MECSVPFVVLWPIVIEFSGLAHVTFSSSLFSNAGSQLNVFSDVVREAKNIAVVPAAGAHARDAMPLW